METRTAVRHPVAAIGNAVSQALGIRLRDALTRKLIMRGCGHDRGIGFVAKNMAAYAAAVAEVEVDEAVRLLRIWCNRRTGVVINPDGAINQLEGGIIQAASWALRSRLGNLSQRSPGSPSNS
jgi:CO/xanthine dehydrogenase Mo-binding subunit